MPLKPPTGTTDAVARYVRAMTARAQDAPLTGTQIKAGTAPTSREKVVQARPTCAVCGKPVEEFTEEDGFLDRYRVFTARCHGEREQVRVELELVHDDKIQFGLAFVPKNMLAAPAPQRLLGAQRIEDGLVPLGPLDTYNGVPVGSLCMECRNKIARVERDFGASATLCSPCSKKIQEGTRT